MGTASFEQKLNLVAEMIRGREYTTAEIGEELGLEDAAVRKFVHTIELAFASHYRFRRQGRERVHYMANGVEAQGRADLQLGLHFALRALAPLAGTSMVRALQKLRDQLPVKGSVGQVDDLARLASCFYSGAPGRSTLDLSGIVSELEMALKTRRWVEVEYAPLQGPSRSYRLAPFGLILRGDHAILCATTKDARRNRPVRAYRIDRIRSARCLEKRFQRPSVGEFDIAGMYADSWGIFLNEQQAVERVTVRVRGIWAGIVGSFLVHPSQTIEPIDDSGWRRVSWDVRVCPELEDWIMARLPDIQVVEPTHLQDRILRRLSESNPVVP